MECRRLLFSGHAVQRMFERAITDADVRAVITHAEVVSDYPDDTPYPSRLLLGFVRGRPLHVVLSYDQDRDECHVITVYEPDPERWQADFKRRRGR